MVELAKTGQITQCGYTGQLPVGQLLERVIVATEGTQKEAAKAAQIDPSALSRSINGERPPPSYETLFKLLRWTSEFADHRSSIVESVRALLNHPIYNRYIVWKAASEIFPGLEKQVCPWERHRRHLLQMMGYGAAHSSDLGHAYAPNVQPDQVHPHGAIGAAAVRANLQIPWVLHLPGIGSPHYRRGTGVRVVAKHRPLLARLGLVATGGPSTNPHSANLYGRLNPHYQDCIENRLSFIDLESKNRTLLYKWTWGIAHECWAPNQVLTAEPGEPNWMIRGCNGSDFVPHAFNRGEGIDFLLLARLPLLIGRSQLGFMANYAACHSPAATGTGLIFSEEIMKKLFNKYLDCMHRTGYYQAVFSFQYTYHDGQPEIRDCKLAALESLDFTKE